MQLHELDSLIFYFIKVIKITQTSIALRNYSIIHSKKQDKPNLHIISFSLSLIISFNLGHLIYIIPLKEYRFYLQFLLCFHILDIYMSRCCSPLF